VKRLVLLFLVALAGVYVAADGDRRKAALDNIQKLLDIVHGMNPSL
jgi:hypothetical protein